MADNYTDTTDTNFKGIVGEITYNIETGKPLSAEGVRNALHTKENVANKVTTLSANSTDAQYPSAKAVSDALATQEKLPIGTILMYDGYGWTDNQTMSGWYICDGRNTPHGRTPNLLDKFIMGSASSGNTGGNNSLKLSIDNMPKHKHDVKDSGHTHELNIYGPRGANGTTRIFMSNDPNDGMRISKTGYANITETEKGSGTAFDNRPNYYSVIYIRKMA
jgi:hypothetical protein